MIVIICVNSRSYPRQKSTKARSYIYIAKRRKKSRKEKGKKERNTIKIAPKGCQGPFNFKNNCKIHKCIAASIMNCRSLNK